VKKTVGETDKKVRIAVMGCIVNGPGEAADADLAVCAAKNKAFIYLKGRKVATVTESQITHTLLRYLNNL
jgi:(E)-4-hydroxy-3-methylbut-2-enyl-diphosphate synthase